MAQEVIKNQMNINVKYQIILIIFISSKMLELLDLAPQVKGKSLEKDCSKAERFNQMLFKLKQRNAMNDLYIKKYLKQAAKKKVKFTQKEAEQKGECSQEQGDLKRKQIRKLSYEGEKFITGSKSEFKRSLGSIQEDNIKYNLLENTNHTEVGLEDDTKINSFPMINYPSATPKIQILLKSNSKPTLQTCAKNRELSKYIKNNLFKQKSNPKKTLSEIIEQSDNQNSSQSRIKTEINCCKYQLSIKSLIFGSQHVRQEKKSLKDDSLKSRFFEDQIIQKCKTLKKYQKQDHFYDDKLISKGVLPSINHQTPKNHKFLENYIRFNGERLSNQRTTVESITDKDPLPKKLNSTRNGMSFRVNTFQLKKQF